MTPASAGEAYTRYGSPFLSLTFQARRFPSRSVMTPRRMWRVAAMTPASSGARLRSAERMTCQ